MGQFDISQSSKSDYDNTVTNFSVDSKSTDGVQDQEETTYVNSDFTKWYGYYRSIPELKATVDTRAIWTIGQGYEADYYTQVVLEHVKGQGIDSFDSILKNMMTIKRIAGDAYAEIIRDPDTRTLINLKPLDPSTIRIVVNRNGQIKRYEQINKSTGKGLVVNTWKPEEIFRLTNKRVADEIHGISDIEAVEKIILASAESFEDSKKIMHRFAKPMRHFQLDTDDPSKIAEFISTIQSITSATDDLFTPQKSVLLDVFPAPDFKHLPWRDHLRKYFFQAFGMPEILLGGGSDFTESGAKISFMVFSQSVKDEQKEIENACWNQLGYKIKIRQPVSITSDLITDQGKDANSMSPAQPSDLTAGGING